MDINVLEKLDIEELIAIEGRLENSLFNLNQLITELYNENCRLSHNNLVLKNSISSRASRTTERIKNLVAGTLWYHSKSSDDAQFDQTNNIENNPSKKLVKDLNYSACVKDHASNSHKMRSSNSKNNVGVTYNGGCDLSIKKSELGSDHIGLKYNPKLFIKDKRRSLQTYRRPDKKPIISIEEESEGRYVVNMLIDQDEYVRIKFPEFKSEDRRERFIKEVISKIGIKAVYFDCLKKILEEVEEKGMNLDYNIDIADLDPWSYSQ